MTSSSSKDGLLIFEYNGTARSGKGTIVKYLAENNAQVAIEETGIDYRAITYALISYNLISPGMAGPEIAAKVESLGLDALTKIVSDRNAAANSENRKAFYGHDVNELVSSVGKVEVARRAVNQTFGAVSRRARVKGSSLTSAVKAAWRGSLSAGVLPSTASRCARERRGR